MNTSVKIKQARRLLTGCPGACRYIVVVEYTIDMKGNRCYNFLYITI